MIKSILCANNKLIARYKIVRGAEDLNGVAGRVNARSKYGGESFADCLCGVRADDAVKKPKKA